MPELPERCTPCRADTPPLAEGAVQAHLADLPRWTLEDGRLHRRFQLSDFRAVLAFTNRVGMLAEEENHHPDFHITGWNRLELVLFTHAIDGLSVNDFVLAKKVEALAAKDGLE